jgi:hypothetical protein
MKRGGVNFFRWFSAVFVAWVAVYVIGVLSFTWWHVMRSDFDGGRHGPLDAYRHALASAVVSHTLGELAVVFVSEGMEGRSKDSNRMDRHNNRVGAGIGTRAGSFSEIEREVRKAVRAGSVVPGDGEQIIWLPRSRWRESRLW